MPRRTEPVAADAPRQIALGDTAVSYRLRRSARRSIGLTIDAGGLAIAAPQRAPVGDIEAVIRQHAAWVLRKLDEWRRRPPPPAAPPLADGVRIPFLNGELTLAVRIGRGRAHWAEPAADALAGQASTLPLTPTLTVFCREASAADIAAAVQAALVARARPVFAERLAHFCGRLGVPVPALAISSARTRWGSCSGATIRLNWRLMQMPPTIIDYVVAHEAAHLLEMNHSPRFWSVVEQLYPDWRSARAELRRRAPFCVS
ncbi:M48 family metallopeptidase [Rhodocyclus tenuis]|uniref:DUF45 domain-containing protein n=2 Tax=Rhodocyclus TaxID=1064 RepID=A0A6L5K016_RHOTE|nr:SprT family zinc-dependent metalloprotease [Rhodocyclus gracilis]MQY52696.1 DUF45 domain-containing protein [Rhodocyclus gracilis]MRD72763.1 DUF45 domain-containing protein [Rhodocyclus gracilis]NJA90171.1 M48 family metallopeptidase [Rhodocyclus gracilis]